MKIYTRTGDSGETSILLGKRMSKSASLIKAIGSIDELNSYLGVILAEAELNDHFDKEILKQLNIIQRELFVAGSDLATPYSDVSADLKKTERIAAKSIKTLETQIDDFTLELPQLHNFILPGGGINGSRLHYARTICRRAEREIVATIVDRKIMINPEVLKYMNRLSDWLFVAARRQNFFEEIGETKWIS